MDTTNHPVRFKQKSDVFIGSKVTEHLVASQSLLEPFLSPKRLYQYLNWTMRISKVSGCMAVMEGQNGGRVLLIDTELHDQCGRTLYALCPPNDVTTHRSQQWQLAALLTADELVDALGIDFHSLPRGVRASSPQFEHHRTWRRDLDLLKTKLFKMDSRRKPIRYAHLKCIQTGKGGKVNTKQFKRDRVEDDVLTVKLSTFYGKVQSALRDDHVDLVPIVSIVSRKNKSTNQKVEDFSVDYLLPVQIGSDWVGVVYRDDECAMALLDHYDISNKAILCDPQFDLDSIQWFSNSFNRLRIVPDDECRSMRSVGSVPFVDIDDTLSVDSRSTFLTECTRSTHSTASLEASSLSLSAYSRPSPSCSPSTVYSMPTMTPPPVLMPIVMPSVQTVFGQMPYGQPSTDDLMKWINELLVNGERQKAYFANFLM
jgi:hypothetical protein